MKTEQLTKILSDGNKEFKSAASVCAALLNHGCGDKKKILKVSHVSELEFNKIWKNLKECGYFNKKRKDNYGFRSR